MVGKIHEATDFWKNELQASPFVLSIIENGYRIPFKNKPTSFFYKNNLSSFKNYSFTTKAIIDLIDNDCVSEIPEPAYCCNPLTVAEKNGKLRLVLDCRGINQLLIERKFKYEGISTVSQIMEPDFYFATFDLKSGYHHISIAPEDQKFLGFSWVFPNGVQRYFKFKVLPFGLASACYVFTKLMRPLVKRWRGLGIRSVVYLDDGILGDKNKDCLEKNISIVKSDLDRAGLTINKEKSHLIPSKSCTWLGFIINSETFKFFVPEKKISALKKLLSSLILRQRGSAREISRVAGMIISMKPAIGSVSQILTRHLFFFINEKPT